MSLDNDFLPNYSINVYIFIYIYSKKKVIYCERCVNFRLNYKKKKTILTSHLSDILSNLYENNLKLYSFIHYKIRHWLQSWPPSDYGISCKPFLIKLVNSAVIFTVNSSFVLYRVLLFFPLTTEHRIIKQIPIW